MILHFYAVHSIAFIKNNTVGYKHLGVILIWGWGIMQNFSTPFKQKIDKNIKGKLNLICFHLNERGAPNQSNPPESSEVQISLVNAPTAP